MIQAYNYLFQVEHGQSDLYESDLYSLRQQILHEYASHIQETMLYLSNQTLNFTFKKNPQNFYLNIFRKSGRIVNHYKVYL